MVGVETMAYLRVNKYAWREETEEGFVLVEWDIQNPETLTV